MTEEEARAEREEAERLLAEISHLQNRIEKAILDNRNLQAELESLIRNIQILSENATVMDTEVNKSIEYLNKKVQDTDINTNEVSRLIDDLINSYFIFKNISTASKNVTQFTDEYYTRFSFFHELRRISLGYVIGLDAHICSDETLRKKVETAYLQNTEYWLAYAIMAVMLWASDEEEAAKRALSKAMAMDYSSASLFFLLINLRFTRVDTAKNWYLTYLDRVDNENLGNDWQYLLQAYLSGVFGVDQEFNKMVNDCFTKMLEQMESMHPNYGKRIIDKTLNYSNTYIYVTANEFETLRRVSNDYEELKLLLSSAEKNEKLAIRFKQIMEDDTKVELNMFQRIENILYDLINSYETDELKVIKNKKYNEMVIKARGDLALAQQFFNNEYPTENNQVSLEDLLFEWAFEEDPERVDFTVKRFSIKYLHKWIVKGFKAYAEEYRKREKEKINISIDGWNGEYNEDSYKEASADLIKYYDKNKWQDTIKDKYVMIFIGMALASILILGITFLKFNKITLIIGILLGIVSGFLLWRRISDMQIILRVKRKKGCAILKKALDELKSFRKMYQEADEKNIDLISVFDNI